MNLTQTEREGSAIEKVAKFLQERVDKHRAKNDTKLDAEETAYLRGQIAEDKALLAALRPPIEFKPTSVVKHGNVPNY